MYAITLTEQAAKAAKAEVAEPQCYVSHTPPEYLVSLIQQHVAPYPAGKVNKILLIAELYRIHPQMLLDVLNNYQNSLGLPPRTIMNVGGMVSSSLNPDYQDTRFSYLPLLTTSDRAARIIHSLDEDRFQKLVNCLHDGTTPNQALLNRANKRKKQTTYTYVGYFMNKTMQNAAVRVASKDEIDTHINNDGNNAVCTISQERLADIRKDRRLIVALDHISQATQSNPHPVQTTHYFDAETLDNYIKTAKGVLKHPVKRGDIDKYEHPRPRH